MDTTWTITWNGLVVKLEFLHGKKTFKLKEIEKKRKNIKKTQHDIYTYIQILYRQEA